MTPALRAAAALLLAVSLQACQKESDAAFGKRVHAYLIEHPEVIEEAARKLQQNRLAQADAELKAAIPRHRAALERDPRDFVANPSGKITVVEFFDYNCGYCKIVAPDVVKLVEDNPDVRFVFKEYAFQTQDSIEAAKIALTPVAKPHGLKLYEALMAQKPLDQAAIDRSLQAAGIDPAAARQAAKAPAIQQHIADNHALAEKLGVNGTPAFIVGETVISGADVAALKAAITKAKAVDLKKPG